MNKFENLMLKYKNISASLPENKKISVYAEIKDTILSISTDLESGRFSLQIGNWCAYFEVYEFKRLYEFLKELFEED